MHTWWSDLPSRINPYIVHIGSFRIGWYGMMYVLAFATVYLLSLYRIRRESEPFDPRVLEDFIFWVAVGLVAGARIGYVFIYNPGYYAAHPIEAFLPFESTPTGIKYTGIAGMSYHGGLLGVVLAGWLCLRRHKVNFWDFADFVIPSIPLGYMLGRLGNFINGELYGRPTDSVLGMYFPMDVSGALRHPSQLYEAAFEGLGLFLLLWPLRRYRPFSGFHLSLYLAGYGVVRFVLEFFREPDAQMAGFALGPLSMGQMLCGLMVLAGGGIAITRRGIKR